MTFRTARLSEICDINPKMPKSLDDNALASFLPMAAVSEEGRIVFEEERPVAEVKKGYTYFERGDVLVAKITPCFENGKAARTISLRKPFGFGSTEFHVLRAPNDVLSDFIFYKIWNSSFRELGAQNMTGSAGQKRVPADFLKRLEIRLPPLEEQRRIVAMLDRADALRRSRKRTLDLLDGLAQAIFLEMFGEETRSITKLETSIADACAKITDGTHHSPKTLSEGIPYITAKHVSRRGVSFYDDPWFVSQSDHNEIYARCNPERGDVLYIKDGATTGIAAQNPYDFPFSMLSSLALLKLNPNKCVPEYVVAWLNNSTVKKYMIGLMSGAGITRLTLAKIKAAKIALPPLRLQNEFARIMSHIRRRNLQMTEAQHLEHLLFSTLQHRAFSGQL